MDAALARQLLNEDQAALEGAGAARVMHERAIPHMFPPHRNQQQRQAE